MKIVYKIVLSVVVFGLVVGCGGANLTPQERAVRRNADVLYAETMAAFEIPMPFAPGVLVESNDKVSIDYSNTHEGYVIVRYKGSDEIILRVVVTAPHDEQYIYTLRDCGSDEVIPLAEGDGVYVVAVYENLEGDVFTKILSVTVDVAMGYEHAPFIRPNQFVDYSRASNLVILAYELTKNAESTDDKISAVYGFVADNFVYDYDLARSVPSGYLPNLDNVLDVKKGICFDYAALVTAMLRSQGIPTMLEIGYHGDEYHAWISVLCSDAGWIENRFHHNGVDWSMLDPTLESGARRAHVTRQEAIDDDEYRVRFNY